ncbi:MAG TPA: Flp pilus assembly protein CpaB [Oxalicibacterium sp.]|nr:Flp pilus assembly protein CpaB [Oxalicibacterium sp.]
MKIQRPNIKINKTWLMLIAAVVLALLTTWLTSKYLAQREQTIEETVRARSDQARGAMVAVVVPVRPMSAGTVLDESTVASRNVPADFVYSDTITVADFEQFKNNVLIRNVERGKPLRKADVQEVFADFSGSLKEGKRAMTINVDEINSVSHMVEPGNLVDLMLVLSSGDGAAGGANQTVVPFLDQVKVLATGQKVTHDDPATPGERKVSYSNFTLEVTPTQAARLALATELGKIRAVLRNENDKQTVDFETVTANNLLDDIRERARRTGRKSSGAYVEYFIGGKASNEPVAPAINVPLAVPGLPAQADAGTAGNAGANQMAAPQTLTDLVKLSLGNTAAPAKSNK